MALSVTNLVGFGAKRAAAGGGGSSLTFVGSTTNSGTGYSVSFHGSAAAGDLAIVGECFDDTTALAGSLGTVPSGWSVFDDTVTTTINYIPARDQQVAIYYKVLTSGDISAGSVSSSVTGGGDTHNGMGCIILRPSSTPTVSTQEVNTSNLTSASVTSSSGTGTVLVVGACPANFGGSYTPTFDHVAGVTDNLGFGLTVYDSSPLDQTVDDDGSISLENTHAAYANVSFA